MLVALYAPDLDVWDWPFLLVLYAEQIYLSYVVCSFEGWFFVARTETLVRFKWVFFLRLWR
jgi:hypothetical protein